ncbi:hypothetical protein BH09ACT5_BH09ACT5_09320 [soil metagenome]
MLIVLSVERVNGEIVTSQQLSEGLVQVCAGEIVVGFVESAGPVFVALFGPRYDRAVEVAQSLSFDAAAAGLLSHARVVASLNEELGAPSAATQPDAPAQRKRTERPAASARVAPAAAPSRVA